MPAKTKSPRKSVSKRNRKEPEFNPLDAITFFGQSASKCTKKDRLHMAMGLILSVLEKTEVAA